MYKKTPPLILFFNFLFIFDFLVKIAVFFLDQDIYRKYIFYYGQITFVIGQLLFFISLIIIIVLGVKRLFQKKWSPRSKTLFGTLLIFSGLIFVTHVAQVRVRFACMESLGAGVLCHPIIHSFPTRFMLPVLLIPLLMFVYIRFINIKNT